MADPSSFSYSSKRSRIASGNSSEPQPRKMKRFDPEKVLKNVRTRLSLLDKLQLASDELVKVASEVMESEEASRMLQKLNDTTRGLVLVAFLGYEETKVLGSAVNMIPKSYGQGSLRNSRVCNILNHYRALVKKPTNITESTVEKLLPVVSICDQLHDTDFLNSLSEECQEGCATFLSPPVSECINPLCNKYGEMNSLAPNHAPVNIVVFSFEGPCLGSKVCLRCKHCSTIYNYNKYGRKSKEGECFYDTERELIEITDVVYVTRKMYSFYRCLW